MVCLACCGVRWKNFLLFEGVGRAQSLSVCFYLLFDHEEVLFGVCVIRGEL
jgi:hypothetical protein